MNKFIRISEWAFVCAGLVLFILPREWMPDYYKPYPMGLAAIGYGLIIALPAWFGKRTKELQQFQAALAVSLILNGIGSLGAWSLYKYGIHYDKFVHFVFPALMMYFGAKLFRRRAIVGVILIVSGIAWEYIEYIFATYFHFGFFGTLFDRDSLVDLLTNVIGVVAALCVISFIRHRHGKNQPLT